MPGAATMIMAGINTGVIMTIIPITDIFFMNGQLLFGPENISRLRSVEEALGMLLMGAVLFV